MDKSRRHWLASAVAACGALWWTTSAAAKKTAETASKGRVIQVQAKKFAYAPNRIAIKRGEAVILEFTALDFMHGFKIPDWNIRADLVPGQVTRVALQPDSVGEFNFLCDNFCGSGHEEMNGKIIVTD